MSSRIITIATICVAGVGCTNTTRKSVAEFDASSTKLVQPAPMAATYRVKVRGADEHRFGELSGTRVYVRRGDPLGFERTPTAVFAYAGEARYELAIEDGATIKWWAERTEPTRLTRAVEAAAQGIFTVAGAAVVVVGEAAIDGLVDDAVGALTAPDNDRDGNHTRRRDRRHRHKSK